MLPWPFMVSTVEVSLGFMVVLNSVVFGKSFLVMMTYIRYPMDRAKVASMNAMTAQSAISIIPNLVHFCG